MKKLTNPYVLIHNCPVCSEVAFSTKGNYEICQNCLWEDDGSTEPYEGSFGPNLMSMEQYRQEYIKKAEEKQIAQEIEDEAEYEQEYKPKQRAKR
jgi:hypothetical protein